MNTYTDFLILLEENGVKIKYRENGCPAVFHPYDSIHKQWKNNEPEPEFKDLNTTLSLFDVDLNSFNKIYKNIVHRSNTVNVSDKLTTHEECVSLKDIYDWLKANEFNPKQ